MLSSFKYSCSYSFACCSPSSPTFSEGQLCRMLIRWSQMVGGGGQKSISKHNTPYNSVEYKKSTKLKTSCWRERSEENDGRPCVTQIINHYICGKQKSISEKHWNNTLNVPPGPRCYRETTQSYMMTSWVTVTCCSQSKPASYWWWSDSISLKIQ